MMMLCKNVFKLFNHSRSHPLCISNAERYFQVFWALTGWLNDWLINFYAQSSKCYRLVSISTPWLQLLIQSKIVRSNPSYPIPILITLNNPFPVT